MVLSLHLPINKRFHHIREDDGADEADEGGEADGADGGVGGEVH